VLDVGNGAESVPTLVLPVVVTVMIDRLLLGVMKTVTVGERVVDDRPRPDEVASVVVGVVGEMRVVESVVMVDVAAGVKVFD